MRTIKELKISSSEAALWWLGQAGYIVRSAGLTVAIDPYLSNSAGAASPEFSRNYPPPINPKDLDVDIFIVTHDHLDHLDPETIKPYRNKSETWFVAPRFCSKKLLTLDVPKERIITLNAGETWEYKAVKITGVFAIPTGIDVLDTTGYVVNFSNKRSFYHTSDTEFHPLVLEAAPRKPEVMLVPINGKWKNPGPEQAVVFASAVQPRYVIPNHYDLMELNSENPETFRWLSTNNGLLSNCIITERMKPFIWDSKL